MGKVDRRLRTNLGRERAPVLDYIDVGARGGMPSSWEPFRELIQLVAVEPDPEEARRLKGVVINAALADSFGVRPFYMTVDAGCSSLHEPNEEFLREFPQPSRLEVAKVATMETRALDEVRNSSAPAFLKIDVQGAEGAVLDGATDTLRRWVVGLEIEVGFAPIYSGQSRFGDVHAKLEAFGFELVDLRPAYWRREVARNISGARGQLVFADALFMLSPRELNSRPALASAALTACMVYRLYDRVVAYSAALPENDVLRRAATIVEEASRTSVDFPGRYRLGRVLKDVADSLLETSASWATSEQRLGNNPRLQATLKEVLRRHLPVRN